MSDHRAQKFQDNGVGRARGIRFLPALGALAAVLSKQGYQKVIDIMNADDQLVKGKANKMRFGTDNFYLALFGKPSATQPWMLQFGGHHLGVNVTIAGKEAVLTPTH